MKNKNRIIRYKVISYDNLFNGIIKNVAIHIADFDKLKGEEFKTLIDARIHFIKQKIKLGACDFNWIERSILERPGIFDDFKKEYPEYFI